jgi:hypothetical protein
VSSIGMAQSPIGLSGSHGPERGPGHGAAWERQAVLTATATGTPLVTMS